MMLMRLMILVCICNYEEDEKNRKILVGYGILAETSVLTPIPRNTPLEVILAENHLAA